MFDDFVALFVFSLSLWTMFLGTKHNEGGGQKEYVKIINSDRWINNRISIMQLLTLIYIMYEGRYVILCKHVMNKSKNIYFSYFFHIFIQLKSTR